jgi:hypothetical protein
VHVWEISTAIFHQGKLILIGCSGRPCEKPGAWGCEKGFVSKAILSKMTWRLQGDKRWIRTSKNQGVLYRTKYWTGKRLMTVQGRRLTQQMGFSWRLSQFLAPHFLFSFWW